MNLKDKLIITIGNINFYKGNIHKLYNPNKQIIFTDIENYTIDTNEDLIKACKRIYKLWYEN